MLNIIYITGICICKYHYANYLRSPNNIAKFDVPQDVLAKRSDNGMYEMNSGFYQTKK